MHLQPASTYQGMRHVHREGTVNGEPLIFPVPLLHLYDEVYATPASKGGIVDGSPAISFLLDTWSFVDMKTGRDVPMLYQGTDVVAAMGRFVDAYVHEGRGLYGADLALFCESWRETTGVGTAPPPR